MEGKVILIISFGAFLGAIARYELQEQLGKNQTINFPLGTFAVNVLGVFFLGIIYGGGAIVQGMNSFFFLVTGFIGAFATFSSFI